jgi:alkanesulfonate monooxygenase SsuD/methylene tetrahydromethanopterin reductase-like flavin-dependent oxidoreductase (luciferase family)
MRIGIMAGQWGWPFAALREAWRAADDLGFDLVGCFDHVSSAPRGQSAWDAPSLLTAMSASVHRAQLGLWVANVSLRHPLLLAGQLAVAQAASGGRVEVGLGAGSKSLAAHDHAALGLPFPPLADRMARLDAMCRVLPALWSGAVVDEPGLGLHRASLGDLGIAVPSLLIGGRSRAALDIAVRHGCAWNVEDGDPATYERTGQLIARLADAAGAAVPAGTVQVFADPMDAVSLRETAEGFAQRGAQTLMFVLDDAAPAAVERVAKAVLGGR